MKYFFTIIFTFLSYQLSFGQCSDLFISEYVEGSSFNKAIEVFNPTDNAIDLSGYELNLYRNGSPTADVTFAWPSGTMLASNDVYVIGHESADSILQTLVDTLDEDICNFNGDDALELKISGGASLDIIGVIGEDPGTLWDVGTGATREFTLVRNELVNEGLTNWNISSGTWDVFPQNYFDDLGSHSVLQCDSTISDPCENSDLALSAIVTDESSFQANDGAIDLTISGGTAPYQIEWNDDETEEDRTNLSPGIYTVTVTDTIGCTASLVDTVDAVPFSGTGEAIWCEDFESYVVGTGIIGDSESDPVNSGDYPDNVTNWTLNVDSAELTATTDYVTVNEFDGNQTLDFRDIDGEANVTTSVIDIDGVSDVTFTLDLIDDGNFEGTDYIDVSYAIDGGNFQKIINYNGLGNDDHTIIDDWDNVLIVQTGISGSSIEIRVAVRNDAGSEFTKVDNICVLGVVDSTNACAGVDISITGEGYG